MIILPKKLNIFGASDFAVTKAEENKDPDYTEHGVFGLASEYIYVLDWWSGRTTSDKWIEAEIELMQRWRTIAWFGEGGVIRRAVEPFLKKRMVELKTYTRLEWINPIKDKSVRGRAFQARASMGRVIFPLGQPWAEHVVDQCVAFPGGKHDDKFDVMSLMCLAIAQAHPALKQPEKPKDEKRDGWDEDERKKRAKKWKVA